MNNETISVSSTDERTVPLAEHVHSVLVSYFKKLDGHQPCDLYHLVIKEVEKPLLDFVMREVDRNQTRAAEMLGINRSTLRKKLRNHGLD